MVYSEAPLEINTPPPALPLHPHELKYYAFDWNLLASGELVKIVEHFPSLSCLQLDRSLSPTLKTNSFLPARAKALVDVYLLMV